MSLRHARWGSALIGTLITVIFAGLMVSRFAPLETVGQKIYDYYFKIRGPVDPPDGVIIAAIDEKSIQRIGRWTWSRDKMARIVENLTLAGAKVIVFDVIFSEEERHDPLLSAAMRDSGRVILPLAFQFDRETSTADSEYMIASSFGSVERHELFEQHPPIMATGVLPPVTALIKQAAALGSIQIFPDDDGVLRWEALVIGYKGYLYPALALTAAGQYLGVPVDELALVATEGVKVGADRYLPTDHWGRALIYYYGGPGTFRSVSTADVLEGKISPKLVKDKIVIIGATAVGIHDFIVPPFAAAMPGVEKHAHMIASILDNKFINKAPAWMDMGVLVISGLLFSGFAPILRAKGVFLASATFILCILIGGYLLFRVGLLWVDVGYAFSMLVVGSVAVTAYKYMVEERFARTIKAMFSDYVTERVVNELLRQPWMAKLGGERKEITVLFSDIRGFTPFSEQHSPEEVVARLNEYFKEITTVIFQWEGTVDKYVGDAIMVFWGAPLTQENHAELAVKCALHMLSKLAELKQKWQGEGKAIFECGIGINTGEVLVGNIGVEGKKMDYTVIGDAVNLASRVESLTRKYDTGLLITEYTLEKIKTLPEEDGFGGMLIQELEKVKVKGKEQSVMIYAVRST